MRGRAAIAVLASVILVASFGLVGCAGEETTSVSPQAAITLYEDAYNNREPATLTMALDPDVVVTAVDAAEPYLLGAGEGRDAVLGAMEAAWATADPTLSTEVVSVAGDVATVALTATFADGTEARYTEIVEVAPNGRISSMDLALERLISHVTLAEMAGGSPDAVVSNEPVPAAPVGGSPDAVVSNS